VVFDGLVVLPYIEKSGDFSRIPWSFRASEMRAPGRPSASAATSREPAWIPIRTCSSIPTPRFGSTTS
jgi:hypothetical protein